MPFAKARAFLFYLFKINIFPFSVKFAFLLRWNIINVCFSRFTTSRTLSVILPRSYIVHTIYNAPQDPDNQYGIKYIFHCS